VTIWKTILQERAQRKWPNWSAHFAWGALLTIAGAAIMHHVLAWMLSMVCGIGWELLWWLTSERLPDDRASIVDACVWILGSIAGGLWVVYAG
jgi:hypothetical protein